MSRSNRKGVVTFIAVVTAIVALSIIAATVSSQDVKSPRDLASGLPTKTELLGRSNVGKTVSVKFSRLLKDHLGKRRRITVSKVEKLRSGGFRYYATVDGVARNITYLLVKRGEIGMINVDGNKPEQNLQMPTYIEDGNKLTAEFWTGPRLLTAEVFEPGPKYQFSITRKHVDDHSFALLAAAPYFNADLKPAKLFGKSAFEFESDGGDAGGGSGSGGGLGDLMPDLSIGAGCHIERRTQQQCDGACLPTPSAPKESMSLFGSRKKKECQNSGCMMCGGICCKADSCKSQSQEVLVCGAGGRLGA